MKNKNIITACKHCGKKLPKGKIKIRGITLVCPFCDKPID